MRELSNPLPVDLLIKPYSITRRYNYFNIGVRRDLVILTIDNLVGLIST